MSAPETVHLIDASPYIFRAYFSIPSSLVDPSGNPVNAVHGYANFLLGYIEEHRPTHLALCYDESLTTSFRNELYPEYKAQRDLPPAELEAQLKACQELGSALGAASYVSERFEADDLIATLCAGLRRDAHRAVIVSSDKDLTQLVEVGEVEFLDAAKGARFGPEEVRAKFGVEPEQIRDLLALAGDAVDNIPGVPRVGPKTAASLLKAMGDMDALYGRLDEVSDLPIRGAKGLAARLEEHRELAFLSRELATLSTDAPIEWSLADLALSDVDSARLRALCDRLGFQSLPERAARPR